MAQKQRPQPRLTGALCCPNHDADRIVMSELQPGVFECHRCLCVFTQRRYGMSFDMRKPGDE